MPEIPRSERKTQNRVIALFTDTARPDFRWDMLELATKAVSQCGAFLKWAENKYALTHFNLYTAAFLNRKHAEDQLAFIRGEAEMRKTDRLRGSE